MKDQNTSIGRREVLLFILLVFTVIVIITIEKYEAKYMLKHGIGKITERQK